MVKRLTVDDASPEVKDFLKQLDVKKGEYILEMAGKPVVGIVPAWQVEKLSQGREEILLLLRKSWERNRAVSEEEIEQVLPVTIRWQSSRGLAGSSPS